MKNRINLIWLSWHKTHYNQYLFNAITRANEFNLNVFYLQGQLNSHPWKKNLNYEYQSKIMDGSGIVRYYRSLLFSKGIFVLAGWNNYHHIISILLFIILKKDFIIWTDTPKVNIKRSIFKHSFRKVLLNFIYCNAKYLFTTGEIGLESFRKVGAPDVKLVNFPFATDTKLFKRGAVISEHIFISSGRLDLKKKCQDLSIKAIGELKKKGFNVYLKIAGAGKDRQLLEDLVQQLGLHTEVEFLGWLQLDELTKFYQSGRYFLHTAAFDPFPNSVLEALACGLPVVGSDTSGSVVDRVESGKNGYMFKTGKLDDLVQKMTSIIKNENYETLAENARKSAVNNDVENNIKTLLTIKNELH